MSYSIHMLTISSDDWEMLHRAALNLAGESTNCSRVTSLKIALLFPNDLIKFLGGESFAGEMNTGRSEVSSIHLTTAFSITLCISQIERNKAKTPALIGDLAQFIRSAKCMNV